MRLLFAALLVLGTTIALTLLAQSDPGYVLFSYAGWSVESSLSLFVVVLALAFAAFYLAIRLLLGTWHLPKSLGFWQRERRAMRSRRRTNRGLIALAEGNWASAEKHLSRSAELSDTPLINYLGAARAAQKQGSEQRRDLYLSQAYQSMPDAELAVGLTQADVQLSQGQTEQALATLRHLLSIAPRHAYVLYLLKKLYQQLQSWDDLLDLLPELRRHKVLDADNLARLEQRIHGMRLANAGNSVERLHQCWQEVPKTLQQTPELILSYAERLKQLGAGSEAEAILHDTLRKRWEPQLMRLYGLVCGDDPNRQLATAEQWLKEHEHHPELLLACGRLCLRSKLWGKARSYLEASLGMEARAETCYELGNLLHQLGEKERAAEYFRQGLAITSGENATNITITPPHRTAGTDAVAAHGEHARLMEADAAPSGPCGK
jgi:HemY protein